MKVLSLLQKFIIMYSCEDLERFYFQYQTEALSHRESEVLNYLNRFWNEIFALLDDGGTADR